MGYDFAQPRQLGLRGKGPVAVITDLCILQPNAITREVNVTEIHLGIEPATIVKQTGWGLRFDDKCGVTADLTEKGLEVFHNLERRTKIAHGYMGADA